MSARSTTWVRRAAALVLVVALVAVGVAWWRSQMPGTYSAAAMGRPDFGGGTRFGDHQGGHTGGTSVVDLVDPHRRPDARVELVARAQQVTLPSGQTFDGYTLNGTTPGPTLRFTQGQYVEVVLRNENVAGGTTLHWHGLDVPAAMDGVAGVTQDAVMPGGSFTYRFTVTQSGTFWYHSHQVSHRQVVGGLFGALVIDPVGTTTPAPDAIAVTHNYAGGSRSINGVVGDVSHTASPGQVVRVRVVNTDNSPLGVWVVGAPFRVLAIDGTDLVGPTPLTGTKLLLTAGARADLEVRVPPSGAVRVAMPGASMVVGPKGATAPPAGASPGPTLDLLGYGTPAATGIDATEADRHFRYAIGRLPGFLRGRPGYWWTINGRMGDDVPMFMVRKGDLVVMTISNSSGQAHPMHLHGHHLLVLSRNGVTATGSPWWVDSLHVENGERYEVAFRADNPGVWMDHCHNLPHARDGLMTHLMYEGVQTPFLLGKNSGNEPE
ncbi:multicopper oxidase family protein [Propionibacteriaceae bacterium G1746]|uniref:multicopper oxidase family protein n=1 Tax=Aestuariimicrobium sp. G57 TaxID=3418485 RepID=UPI003C295817